ncbi:MAG: trigger factor [Chloroflexi bacterium]|nr:trigger factor [Chloroflexota bacterium]
MKVAREKTENRQVFLTVEMEPAEMEAALEKSYRRLVKKTDVPGFRKGMVPRAILERHIGRKRLVEDALRALIPDACEKAIKEQEIEAFSQPEVEITQTDPAVFKVTVPLPPLVTLGDYRNIQVAPPPVEFSEDSVAAALEVLRHRHATWEPVERPLEFGDMAVLDVTGEVEGKPFADQEGVQFHVHQDSPIPGFAEQLAGMKRDEVKEFKLHLPEDYPDGAAAGKETSFKVEVKEIKQEKHPELNDDFARQVDPDIETLELLRERVSANLKMRAEENARMKFEEQVIEAVVGVSQLEFPPVLVEDEIEHLLKEQVRGVRGGLEDYLRSVGKTEAELREELRPLATKRVSGSLVLGRIAQEEKIEVGDSEVDAEIERMTKDITDNKDKLQEFLNVPQRRDSIRQMLVTRKTVQHLAEMARASATQA